MPRNRVQVGARVDRDTYERFKAFTEEHKGQVRGELGRMLDNAMREYMNNDRAARIERKLDRVLETLPEESGSHAHTANESKEKVKTIARELGALDSDVIHNDEVRRVIEDVAGMDERTIEKYQRQLKRQELAYEHPNGDVWTIEQATWLGWAENYLDNNPTASVLDVIEDYPLTHTEYDQLTTEVPA